MGDFHVDLQARKAMRPNHNYQPHPGLTIWVRFGTAQTCSFTAEISYFGGCWLLDSNLRLYHSLNSYCMNAVKNRACIQDIKSLSRWFPSKLEVWDRIPRSSRNPLLQQCFPMAYCGAAAVMSPFQRVSLRSSFLMLRKFDTRIRHSIGQWLMPLFPESV